jgi:hypothetical protein
MCYFTVIFHWQRTSRNMQKERKKLMSHIQVLWVIWIGFLFTTVVHFELGSGESDQVII